MLAIWFWCCSTRIWLWWNPCAPPRESESGDVLFLCTWLPSSHSRQVVDSGNACIWYILYAKDLLGTKRFSWRETWDTQVSTSYNERVLFQDLWSLHQMLVSSNFFLWEHVFLHDCFASTFRIYFSIFCPFERNVNLPTPLACIWLKIYSYLASYCIF